MRLIVLIEFDCVAKLVYVAISELISLSLLYNNIFNKSAFAIPTIFIVNHMIFWHQNHFKQSMCYMSTIFP